jgi:hypothetical protein
MEQCYMFDYTITWPRLILALKRHVYGDEHGRSLDVFNHETGFTFYSSTGSYGVTLSIEARIAAGRLLLLLRCTYIISQSSTSNRETMTIANLKALALNPCRYVGTGRRRSPWYDNRLAHKLSSRRGHRVRLRPR